jgi:hypothetical protein
MLELRLADQHDHTKAGSTHHSEGVLARPAISRSETEDTMIERRAFCNERGEVICYMLAEREKQNDTVDTSSGPVTGKRLVRLELAHPSTGKNIDILSLIRLSDISVHVSNERVSEYCYSSKASRVIVPPLETAIDLAVLLHEFGHASQDTEKELSSIVKMHNQLGYLPSHLSLPMLETIEAAREAFPFLRNVFDETYKPRLVELLCFNSDALELHNKLYLAGNRKRLIEKEKSEKERELSSSIGLEVRDTCLPFAREWRSIEKDLLSVSRANQMEDLQNRKQLLLGKVCHALDTSDLSWENLNELFNVLFVQRKKDIVFSVTRISGSEVEVSLAHILGRPITIRLHGGDFLVDAALLHQEVELSVKKEADVKKEIELKNERLEELKDELQRKTAALRRDIPVIFEINNLFRRFLERDATRRAFLWIKEILNQTGIDLLQPMLVEKRSIINSSSMCQGSVESALPLEDDDTSIDPSDDLEVTDITTNLGNALWSYLATTKIMEDRYGAAPKAKGFDPADAGGVL